MPSINLEANPFACDCFSLDLAKFMHEELDAVVQTWFRAKIDDVVCRSPPELAPYFLLSPDCLQQSAAAVGLTPVPGGQECQVILRERDKGMWRGSGQKCRNVSNAG